jgi:hypothetical protein
MATRTLAGDLETIAPDETVVVSPLNVNVSVILPAILDRLSHGYSPPYHKGVLGGHSLTVQANGLGNVSVLDSHQLPVAVVAPSELKLFIAEGIEVGNRWNVVQ